MTDTKYYKENISRSRGTDPNKGKVIIDTGDYDEDPVREWMCPNCNHILNARKSRKEIDCPSCKATLDLGDTQETKTLEDPNKSKAPNEVHVFTTPAPVSPFAEKPVELKGAALAMSQRGIHFTKWEERGGDGKLLSSWNRREEDED